MNILDIVKYYVDNINDDDHRAVIKEIVLRNKMSMLSQIQVLVNNPRERERALHEIEETMKGDEQGNREMSENRFGEVDIAPLKQQKQVIKYQTEDLTMKGILKIRTENPDILDKDALLNFFPEEQNLIITLILEYIVDTFNAESYAYTIESILLRYEDQIVHQLTNIKGNKINMILLSSIRTLISYIIAAGLFQNEIVIHSIESYMNYIDESRDFEVIKSTILFMNNA